MRTICKAFLLAAGSLLVMPAYANETEDEEVVVTATRSPTALKRLPADVTLIDVESARERGAVTLDTALATVPGVQISRTGPLGQQASIFSGGFESNHTLVLFDGVRMDDPSTPEGIFDAGQDLLGDAERIEVVQGPMSALYGSGALGGVVNILPRHGGEGAFNPRLEAVAGSFGAIMGTIGADGTIGALRYALTADAYASEGYDIVPERIAAYSGEKDGAEMRTLTGAFDLALNDEVSLDLLLRRREAQADYDPGFFGNIGENPEAEIRQNDSALWRFGAHWTPSPSLSFRIAAGESETDRVTADAGAIGDEYHGDRAFADATATWRVRGWTVLLGGQTESESIDAISFGAAIAGEQKHVGAFAAAQGALGDLDVTAALRRDDFDGFGARTTWRAGASYALNADVRLYAAYGTSYRTPSLYERFVPFFGALGLQPETARSWEVGSVAKLALFGRADGLELHALYRSSDIDDLIGFAGFTYANVDRAEIDFAETRLTLRPLSWLAVRAAYASTDARDADTGEQLQRRPRHAWSAALAAERGRLAAEISWREVGARRDTRYDDMGLFAGAGRVEAYDIVSASAAWSANDTVKFYVAADNVLDAVYEPVNGFAGAPASVWVGVRVTPSGFSRSAEVRD
jgi:vitamin B12 transporter